MKKVILIITSVSVLFYTACNSGNKSKFQPPKPGQVVVTAEMPSEDKLNHATFSVKVAADSDAHPGVYTVNASSGQNLARGQFTLPRKGESFEPVLRKGAAPYTFIIGFRIPDDTAFYDYFEVSSIQDTIKMKYLKSYSFDTK